MTRNDVTTGADADEYSPPCPLELPRIEERLKPVRVSREEPSSGAVAIREPRAVLLLSR